MIFSRPRQRPDESTKAPYARQVTSADIRKMRKNSRERARRHDLKDLFDNLADILMLSEKGKPEKYTVLHEAINEIKTLREEIAKLQGELEAKSAPDALIPKQLAFSHQQPSHALAIFPNPSGQLKLDHTQSSSSNEGIHLSIPSSSSSHLQPNPMSIFSHSLGHPQPSNNQVQAKHLQLTLGSTNLNVSLPLTTNTDHFSPTAMKGGQFFPAAEMANSPTNQNLNINASLQSQLLRSMNLHPSSAQLCSPSNVSAFPPRSFFTQTSTVKSSSDGMSTVDSSATSTSHDSTVISSSLSGNFTSPSSLSSSSLHSTNSVNSMMKQTAQTHSLLTSATGSSLISGLTNSSTFSTQNPATTSLDSYLPLNPLQNHRSSNASASSANTDSSPNETPSTRSASLSFSTKPQSVQTAEPDSPLPSVVPSTHSLSINVSAAPVSNVMSLNSTTNMDTGTQSTQPFGRHYENPNLSQYTQGLKHSLHIRAPSSEFGMSPVNSIFPTVRGTIPPSPSNNLANALAMMQTPTSMLTSPTGVHQTPFSFGTATLNSPTHKMNHLSMNGFAPSLTLNPNAPTS